MTELSDADVFGAPKEMSDADVMGGGSTPAPPISGPDGWTAAAKPMVNSTGVGSVMKAFGEGFGEAWGPERLGLSKENTEWLAKAGIFAQGSKFENPFQAFNEGVMVNAATVLDGAVRTVNATYRGLQAAGIEAGLHRDIVSLPDAFMGSPGALGHVEFRPGLPKAAAIVAEEAPVAGAPPLEAGTVRLYRGERDWGPYPNDLYKPRAQFWTTDLETAKQYGEPRYIDVSEGDLAQNFSQDVHGHYQAADGGFQYHGLAQKIDEAHDLGVIGPERPPMSDAPPREAAAAVTSRNAEGPKGEKVTQEMPGQKDAWQERFEGFVQKLEAPDDVKQLIRDAAKENGDFVPARQGDIPLSHVEGIAEAAGVEAGEINARGLGRKLQNDNEVRVAMQMMLQVTDDVKTAAREVKADGSPESMIKLQEAIMRRDLAVEQVVGLRAEWGRTGNVIQEFTRDVKDQEGLNNFLKGKGRTPADLTDIAHTIDALDRGQAARLLNDMRTPSAWDKFKWYWVNSLISGPVTHAKYVVANAAFGAYESAVVTPVAGAIGTARRAVTGGAEGVYMGEAAARTWGLVAGTPDALVAAWKAAKTNLQTPLPGEVAQNIVPKRNKNVAYQQTPISGALGTVVGLPSRGASAIHSFFNFLGYRASIEAQAYRQAAKEGLSPIARPSLDERMSALTSERGGLDVAGRVPEDKLDLHQALSTASLPGLSFERASQSAKWAMENGREDVAQAIIDRLQREADRNAEAKPGVGTDSPRYADIQKGLDSLAKESRNQVDALSKELGLEPGQQKASSPDSFWQRRAAYADRPTPEMMNDAIEEGYRLTYITELGETGRKLSAFVNSTKAGQLIMPFTHIPLNILRRSLEGTPAAFLDAETRDALAGKSGAVKQDMAVARMVAGTAVGTWAINMALNDRITGFGPTDQKERAQWLATGHRPYSLRIGDEWLSFNRFGSLGTMLGLYSNLAEVIPHLKPDGEEITKAIGMTVHSTGRLMEDEVGMQGLAGLMEAINEPDRRGARFVANFAGSLLPYSSMQRQVASASDPYMREAKTVVDGLRYYIPGARQGLHYKRDWLGAPLANAGYGGDIPAAPGASAIIQHGNAVADPIATEMTTLDLHPAPPQDRIHGVKLPASLYDTYQATAGPFLRQTLENYISQPGWSQMPVSVRQDIVKNAIKVSRSSAAAAMQMQHPELIQQAVKDRVDRINGVKPTKLKD